MLVCDNRGEASDNAAVQCRTYVAVAGVSTYAGEREDLLGILTRVATSLSTSGPLLAVFLMDDHCGVAYVLSTYS